MSCLSYGEFSSSNPEMGARLTEHLSPRRCPASWQRSKRDLDIDLASI
jgi:hypothetical protein